MIRQAHTYLIGALSGVTLIAIAIAAFVFLVSTQVFHEWPIAAIGAANHKTAVAPAKALSGGAQTASAAGTDGTHRARAATARRNAAGTGARGATVGRRSSTRAAHRHPGQARTEATGPATVVTPAPSASSGGNQVASTGGSSASHSHASSPSSSSTNSTSSTSSSTSGSSSGGSSGSSGSSSGSGSGSTGSGGSGGGGGTTLGPVTAGTKPLAQEVTEVVNGTVNGVDEAALGGTLEESGVTHVTEEVVGGLAAPETVIGQTVNGVGEVVGGLLGGGH